MSTESELEQLTARVQLIEEVLNKVQTAMLNLATRDAVSQIALLKQKDIEDMLLDIQDLQTQVELIRGELFR